ncbi:hypothetical protein P8452_50021 [Trifolium repens]|nr:hypothetical protein P8452_50021 [Trifolium repens]
MYSRRDCGTTETIGFGTSTKLPRTISVRLRRCSGWNGLRCSSAVTDITPHRTAETVRDVGPKDTAGFMEAPSKAPHVKMLAPTMKPIAIGAIVPT